MKTVKHIREKVTDHENLYKTYLHARKSKRFRSEVLEFSANLEDNLHELQDALRSQTYRPGPYYRRVIHDPVGRLIMWQDFIHRVVQWAVYQVINPAFVQGCIEDSYACIKGRGSDAAARRLFYFMQQDGRVEKSSGLDSNGKPVRRFYLQKMDVRPEEMVADKGLAVGSLLNQMLANVNMNEVDHFVKRQLRVRQYVRYVDDSVMLSDSKAQLLEWRKRIEEFAAERLKLELNPKKTFIQPISHGIDFCQYRIYPDHIKLKKATALRMKRNLKRVQRLYAEGKIDLERAQRTVTSYMGLLSHCDSYQLHRAIFGEYSDTEWVEGWFCLRRDSGLIPDDFSQGSGD